MTEVSSTALGDIMDLADKLFPRDFCLALHRLPRLVSRGVTAYSCDPYG